MALSTVLNPIPGIRSYGLTDAQLAFLEQQQANPGLQVPDSLKNQPGQIRPPVQQPTMRPPVPTPAPPAPAQLAPSVQQSLQQTQPAPQSPQGLQQPQQTMQATGVPQQAMTQPYGLSGAEQAITMGGLLGTNQLQQTMLDLRNLFSQGQQGLRPFSQAGTQANDQQAALSGALGPEAQAQAMQAYRASPFLDQVRQNAERAILQNASATGSLGSGNTLDQLYQNAAGLFMDDFNNNFARLDQVANRGYGAATTGAGLYGQEAGLQGNLGSQAAQIPFAAGNNIGTFRYQAGRDIASNIGGVSGGLADLNNQQGAGLTDILSQGTNNIQNLIQGYYGGDAASKEQLMTLLSNLASQTASTYTAVPNSPVAGSNYLGQLGSVASGVGGLMYGMNAGGMFDGRRAFDPSANLYNNVNPVNYGGYA